MKLMMIGMMMAALMLVSGCKDTGQSGERSSTAQAKAQSLTFVAPAAVRLVSTLR